MTCAVKEIFKRVDQGAAGGIFCRILGSEAKSLM